MIHRAPDPIPPLFARPPDPGDDDAPRLGGNGASADDQISSHRTRLPLTPPATHNAPPGTSGVAAQRIASHASAQRAAILAVIVRAGALGATDAEIEAATGIRAQSVSPRRGELRRMGLIVNSGRRRPTPRGRPAAVWVTPNHARKPEGGAA